MYVVDLVSGLPLATSHALDAPGTGVQMSSAKLSPRGGVEEFIADPISVLDVGLVFWAVAVATFGDRPAGWVAADSVSHFAVVKFRHNQ